LGEPSVKRRKAVGISIVIAIYCSDPFDAALVPAGKENLLSQECHSEPRSPFERGEESAFSSIRAKSRSLTRKRRGFGMTT